MAVWDILFPVAVADPFIENIECSECYACSVREGRRGGVRERGKGPGGGADPGVDPRIVAVVGVCVFGWGVLWRSGGQLIRLQPHPPSPLYVTVGTNFAPFCMLLCHLRGLPVLAGN